MEKWWNPPGPMVRTLILNDSNNDDDDSDDDDSDDDDDDGAAFDNSVPLFPPGSVGDIIKLLQELMKIS